MKIKHQLVAIILMSAASSLAIEGTQLSKKYQGIPHDAFYDICFSKDNGLVVGADGVVMQTQDGGNHWQSLHAEVGATALLGVACGEERHLLVGQEGAAYLLQGESLRLVPTGTENRLLSVSMNRHGLAFAVGGFGTVLRSLDGGESWSTLQIDWETILDDFVEPHIYDVSVTDDGRVLLVGEFELVLRSNDGGNSWNSIRKGDASLFALHLDPTGIGYAVGQNGTVLQTRDDGSSWTRLPANTSANLLGVWVQQNDVVISGIRALLHSQDGGQSWQKISGDDIATGWYQGLASSSPDPAVTGAGEHRLFMVGHSGRVVEFERLNN